MRASKEICPGRLAVSRTTMTWSGALANTSRENVTPPLVIGHVSRCRRQVEIAPVVLDRVDLPETSARDRRPSGTASARAASTSPSRRRASPRRGTCRSAISRRTSGSASFASGFTGSYGRPAHSVSSFSCSRSWTMPPNTIAPSRPLPTGSARTHSAVPAWRLCRGASSGSSG